MQIFDVAEFDFSNQRLTAAPFDDEFGCFNSQTVAQTVLSTPESCELECQRSTESKEGHDISPLSTVSLVVATFSVARLTLQTRKLWLVGVATDRHPRYL